MLGKEEFVMRAQQSAEAAAMKEQDAYAIELELNREAYKEVVSAMEQGQLEEASSRLDEAIQKYPGRSFSHIMMARLSLKKGGMADAIGNYRQAVEKDPDYIDKKTPLFVGEEIKVLVKEGLEKFSREKKLRPDDQSVQQALKDVYYLQRRLLGGCE
jgi:tetratricopeptide (TPR) repeat protein